MNSIKFLSKITFAATFGLALAFTISCSSDDDKGGGGSSVTGGADGGGNQFSQIYNQDNSLYTGSGIIEISSTVSCSGISCEWNGLLKVGSVTDGIVKLELPENIPNEYLENIFGSTNCSDSYGDIKAFVGVFVLTNDNKEYLGVLSIDYNDNEERISYVYFSKAGKIKTTCNFEEDFKINIDANVGWNKVYLKSNYESKTIEYTTNNILTKEMKWRRYYND